MNVLKFLFSFFLSVFVLHGIAFSQQVPKDSISINTIITKTGRLSTDQPFEKVYLHFDKPYYAIQDTIWFKAYITSLENQPSTLSKVVYIEVFSSRDSLVSMLKLPIINGVSSGNIALSESAYKQGNYRVRAYTKWMTNFGTEYFFDKMIPVGNAINKSLVTDVSFLNAVERGDSRSVVKVQYKDGEGQPYADRRINWTIESGYDVLSKGRETTDSNGFISVELNSEKHDLAKSQLITVLSLDNQKSLSSSFPLKKAANSIDVQFFPEGGELIDGISSKVAFKAIKSDGLGKDIRGEVVDNAGSVIVNFQSQHLGMGFFTLAPELGKSYTANVFLPDGSKSSYALSAVEPEGISLQVNSVNAENLGIRISANTKYFEKYKNKGFYLVGMSGNVIYYAAQTNLNKPVFTAAIPKDKFPPGILQLTLFNSAGEALTERLVFIEAANSIKIDLSADRQIYSPKQKVQLKMTATSDTSAVVGNFSIAVIDETRVPFNADDETTILSHLLLTSDLKGFIEKPNYYFNKANQKKVADLDVLMLTQGYRRFSYKEVLADRYPPISILPEQGIEVSGTLRTNTGMPVNKGKMSLSIPDKHFSAFDTTDAEGRFKFSNLVFADSSKVIVSSRNTVNSRNMMIMLDGNYLPAITSNLNIPQQVLNIDSVLDMYLQNSKKQYRFSHLLQEVVIKGAPAARPSHADHPALSSLSMPDHLISGDRFAGCNDLLSCLRTSVVGMTFDKENFYVSRDYNAGSRVPAQVYLNGFAVDIHALSTITPAQVESVEIFLKDELGLVNKATQTNGILVVNTRETPKGVSVSKQQLLDLLPKNNEVSLTALGYTKVREFYSPKYDLSKNLPNDLRTTIYWNPNVVTDKEGKAAFNYFNADGKGTYRVVVEGIDSSGNLGRSVYRYTVK